MKKLLLLLLFLLAYGLKAQIVNIPDSSFKESLLSLNTIAKDQNGNIISLDANNDSEIQVSEAEAVWDLMANHTGESVVGLEAFINLRKLYFGYASNNVSFTMLSNLEELTLDIVTGMQSLDISNLIHLKKLYITYSDVLTTINWNGSNNLEVISILAFVEHPDFTQLQNLKKFWCFGNVKYLDFTNNHNLEEFYYEMFSVPGAPVEIKGFAGKQHLNSFELVLPYWIPSFPPFPEYADLPLIDLSGCPSLTKLFLDIGSTTGPRYINLKNGVTDYAYFNVNLHPTEASPVSVCIDEVNQDFFLQNGLNNTNILLNSYCSPGPGDKINTISGTVTYAGNSGECGVSTEFANFARVAVSNASNESMTFVNLSGNYNLYVEEGNFTLAPQLENSTLFTVTPTSATVSFADVNNNIATQNFCITPNGNHPDVEVVVVPLGVAQPGFDAYYKIIYKNKGNQNLSGAVNFTYDDAVLDYVSAAPAYASSSTGQLGWNYSNLLPFESRSIEVMLNVNGPMETPPVNIGDNLNYTVAVTPTAGDETPVDNTFSFNQEVVGSFDPNDITCLQGETVHPDKIGQYLHYNINFENTGTAPATFIVVKDVIDAQKFDISSLQVLNASHNVETRVTGNKVEFIFDDINLGAQGKGNIAFKIKTKPTVAVNSTVTQKADIFFDYNWPITTNDANTTFTVLSRGDFAVDNTVKVYPNPAKNIVIIEAGTEIKSVQLYDVQGRLLQSLSAEGTGTVIDISSKPAGIYLMKINTEKGAKVEKVIKE